MLTERKPRKRGPSAHTREQREQSATVSKAAKQEIFDYWKTVMNKKSPVLDSKRDGRIGWAIKNYGMELCRNAIDGCAGSDWHMGKNPNNKAYNDIALIFRDAEKVEMFLERYEKMNKKDAKSSWIEEDPW